jgi:hypothetical protein
MAEHADDPFPDLPEDRTPEQVIQRGRDLMEAHARHVEQLKELEAALKRIMKETSMNGLTTEEAQTFAKLKDDIAAMKVRNAASFEQNELGREVARKKGYDI